ncbi:MAG: hypothetical protein K6T17_06870 [Fimbriimonadales bacterium]|nr:hypothetical protein [Fimbriimonadales bacterium]
MCLIDRFKTAMGFLYWAEKGCDYVALEVGLGGRLDATNVVIPLVSVITEIALDHQDILGNTISEIAWEKAGIIKEGRPCVCLAGHPEAQAVIQKIAEERGSELWLYGRDIQVERREDGWKVITPRATYEGLRSALRGGFQGNNIAAAVGALDAGEIKVEDSALRSGLMEASLPGRFQVISNDPEVVLDGAHNPSAMEALVEALQEEFPGVAFRVVFSGSTGHDTAGTLSVLRGFARRLYLCQMLTERALPLESLERHTLSAGFESGEYETACNPAEAVRRALDSLGENEGVLITGSFYLLKEALEGLRERVAG